MKIEDAIKQKNFSSEYQKAFINVEYTHNWLKGKTKQLFNDNEVTQQQYNVLRILRGAHPDVRSAGEIKSVMLDKSPDLTRLMDRLVKKGYAEREMSESNRRKIEIKITESGLKLLDKLDPKILKIESIFHSLSPEEATQLSDLLDKLREE